ncbi:MAG: YihY/virulence factor BrkB family protein [Planctomycetes bacterium]|nr:YihY/virulence factor BrkB family protein [Planctomycetota bacterium]
MKVRDAGKLIKDAGVKFWDDKGQRLGAALAFYSALSLSPLLLVVVAIAGLAFGEEAARGELVEQLRDTIGQEAAVTVEQLVAKSADSSQGIAAAVVAFAVLLFGASGVFSELQSALNTIWQVPGRKSEGGFLSMIRERLLSFSLVAATAFLLLVSLVISAILAGINGTVSGWLPQWTMLAGVLNFVVNLGLLTLLFAMIFKWLPEIDLAWSDVWLGAFLTAILFGVGRYLIGLYLGKAAIGSAYGAAGAFIVLLVWIYYSTQILLFGAELTFVYAERYGHGIPRFDATGQPRNETQLAST